MKLSAFIRDNLDPILEEWEETAEAIFDSEVAKKNRDALRDHAKEMLDFIASNVEQPQTDMEQVAKSRGQQKGTAETGAQAHGIDRMEWGFSLDQVITEHRALRASVTKLWGKHNEGLWTDDIGDLIRLNEAMDQVLSEAVASYSIEKEKQTRLFETMLSSSPDQSYIVDTGGRFMYVNEAATEMFGCSVKDLLRTKLTELDIPAAAELYDRAQKVIETGRAYRGEVSIRPPSGEERQYEYVYAPVLDENGKVDAVAAASRDVTERRAAEHQIWRNANFDPLTEIPNRRLFVDRLEQGMKTTARRKSGLALLFIDLDRFKAANDRLGHEGGDMLLKQAAERIVASVREADTVARLGGDEFVVILKDVTVSEEAGVVGEKILSNIDRPLMIGNQSVRISGSIGIAFFPADGRAVNELIQRADHAMYAAKAAGGNRVRFYDRDARHPA